MKNTKGISEFLISNNRYFIIIINYSIIIIYQLIVVSLHNYCLFLCKLHIFLQKNKKLTLPNMNKFSEYEQKKNNI